MVTEKISSFVKSVVRFETIQYKIKESFRPLVIQVREEPERQPTFRVIGEIDGDFFHMRTGGRNVGRGSHLAVRIDRMELVQRLVQLRRQQCGGGGEQDEHRVEVGYAEV